MDDETFRLLVQRLLGLSEGVRDTSVRQQHHTVFAENAERYHGVVLKPGATDIHARTKTAGEIILGPSGSPIFARHESKVKPDQPDYMENMRRIFRGTKIGSFDKFCADVAVWRSDLSYTGTVSLVQDTVTGNSSHQFELEYDGHRKGTDAPSPLRIITELDALTQELFEGHKLSTLTKLAWILGPDGDRSLLPEYVPVRPEESKVLPR